MNVLLLISTLTLALSASPNSGQGQSRAQPIQKGKPHPMACSDYSQGKVFLVSPQGKVEWEYPVPSCNDLWVLPSGNLLFVTGHGVKEVTRDKKVVFDYQSKSDIGKSPHVIEVTPDKKVAWTFADHKTMKTISSIQLLDIPGDVTKGEIAH